MIDKVLVKKRFKRSLGTYEEAAIAQMQMNARLCGYLNEKDIESQLRILEIGCGTGTLTKQLFRSLDIHEIFLNDIVEEIINPVQNILSADNFDKCSFVIGDAEEITFPAGLNLVVSGSTFQWFKDLPAMFEKIYNVLNPGGMMVFSTFGMRNLMEIKEISGKGLEYYSLANLKKIASNYFEILNLEEEIIPLYFPDVTSIIQHVKKTGVNAVSSVNWSKSYYHDFLNKYENYKTKRGYSLTYNPIYFIGRKNDL